MEITRRVDLGEGKGGLSAEIARVKTQEQGRSSCYVPDSAILIGGGGHVGQKYGPLFVQGGLPVSAVIDTRSTDEALSTLPNTQYLQVTDGSSVISCLEEALDAHPQAAVFITTPQGTHIDVLEQIAPLVHARKAPVRIEKPLATNLAELKQFLALVNDPRREGLLNQMVAGGYTLDKATPELIALGALPATDSLIRHIRPVDPDSPDFATTYSDPVRNRESFGDLKRIGFHFHEGRPDIRDVVGGKFGNRTYLALYPGGGLVSDLTDHVTDKLIALGHLTPDSRLFSTFLGYIPMGIADTPFPWPVPENEGLAEFHAETTLKTGNVPLVLGWGKRAPQFLGDKRKSTFHFENATLSTDYSTNEHGQSNIFSVTTEDTQHSYYLDADPWALMLKRFRGVWSNDLPGTARGIYPQVVSTAFQTDIVNIWKGDPTVLFATDPRHRLRNGGLEARHVDKMKRDEKWIRGGHRNSEKTTS